MNPDELRERLDDLLADRALQGLTDRERRELSGLVDDAEAEGIGLELAAAELELALIPADFEPLPASLRARVDGDAGAFFSRPGRPRRRFGARVLPWAGWVAAAASLLIATQVGRSPSVAPPVAREPSLVERLAGLDARPLAVTDHPLARGGRGSLVWSGDRQEGYLQVRGLAEVDPSQGVYQLWIFDATRDERFPVDGGSFTVEDAKAIKLVPIRPSVVVRRPTLFAVTLEPPGGVVVSDRKRILLTASPAP